MWRILLVLGCVQKLHGATVEITNPYPAGIRPQGEHIAITCRVTNMDINDVVKWERKSGDNTSVISIGTALHQLYRDTLRYSISTNNQSNQFILNIQDIRPEDASVLQCRVGSVVETTQLKVYVKPTVSINNFTDGQLVQFVHLDYVDQGANIQAFVNGCSPEPTVKVFLGIKDVTYAFVVETISVQVGVQGLTGLIYNTSISNSNFPVPASYDKEQLTVQAQVMRYPPVTSSFILDIMAKPKINCGIKNYETPFETQNFEMHCYYWSNPDVSSVYWMWDNKRLEVGGQVVDGVSSSVKQTNSTNEITLHFDEVLYQHFTKYDLFIENSLANATISINLVKGSVVNTRSAGFGIVPSMLFVITTVYFQYCLV